jgi:hypothetical protein
VSIFKVSSVPSRSRSTLVFPSILRRVQAEFEAVPDPEQVGDELVEGVLVGVLEVPGVPLLQVLEFGVRPHQSVGNARPPWPGPT